MMKRMVLTVLSMFALAACGTGEMADTSDPQEGSAAKALAQSISVPVGDPITMVAAPFVSVTAKVGDTLTFTTTGPACSLNCNYSWRNPDAGIARYGGVILGYGPTLTTIASVAGNSRVTLDYCVKTSARFQRCILTYVYITTNP